MGHTSHIKNSVYIVICCVILSGCKAIDKLTKFNMDYETDIVYNSGLPINIPFDISSPDVQTSSEQEFSINDTRKDLIESIKLTELKLNITSPSGKTFSFLKEVLVYISSDGLPEVEVARKTNIDDSVGSELMLDPLDVELKEYIKADKFVLKVSGTIDQLLVSQVNVHVYSKFFVDAKILGI